MYDTNMLILFFKKWPFAALHARDKILHHHGKWFGHIILVLKAQDQDQAHLLVWNKKGPDHLLVQPTESRIPRPKVTYAASPSLASTLPSLKV